MRAGQPKIVTRGDEVTWECRVTFADGREQTLHYTVADSYRGLLSPRPDAAAVALLIPAMRRNENLFVDGTLSERLTFSLNTYQHLLRLLDPSLNEIRIEPEDVDRSALEGNGIATGFSGGVDSFAVLARHHYGDPPAGFRLTHLLFNNVGSHGTGGERLFRERYHRLAPTAERLGLPFIAVNSNLDSFYSDKFITSHTPRNVSVALALQGGVHRFLYASAYAYSQITLTERNSIAHADPIGLPLLSTSALHAVSSGGEYTRVGKTMLVARIPESYRCLDVCTDATANGNCSRCNKCLRTLLTLEIGNYLERYEGVFNFDVYQRSREDFITRVLTSQQPLMREIREAARDMSFTFPIRTRLRARAVLARAGLRAWAPN